MENSTHQKSNNYLFHLAIIGANIIWGLYATVCKGLLTSQLIGSWALCGLKLTGGALLFILIWLILPKSMVPHEKIATRDLLQLFVASLFINVGSQSCIILGLNYTSPIDGTVICSMAPIFTIAIAAIIHRQHTPLFKTIGIILGFAGAMIFVMPQLIGGPESAYISGSNPMFGNLLMVTSQILGALYLLLFTDVLSRYNVINIITMMFIFAAITILPFTITDIVAVQWQQLTLSSWLQLAYIIVMATCTAYLLLIVGQQRVTPEAISMYNYVQPITAMVSSLAIGMATLSLPGIIATALCLTGVYIVAKK